MSDQSAGDATPEIPYRFDRTHETAEVVEAWSSLAPGEESGVTVGVAGRVMLLRDSGQGRLRRAARQLGLGAAVRAGRGDGALRRVREAQPRRLGRGHG